LNIAQSKVVGDTAWAYGDWSVQASGHPLRGNWVTIYERDNIRGDIRFSGWAPVETAEFRQIRRELLGPPVTVAIAAVMPRSVIVRAGKPRPRR
jgi:hypothetical protein